MGKSFQHVISARRTSALRFYRRLLNPFSGQKRRAHARSRLEKRFSSPPRYLGSISATSSARAQDATDEQFGKVHLQTSCNEVAQRRFDRGMRYQHSFWYRPAKEIFEETLQADPECAIAYWGIALSLLYNPHFAAPKGN